MVVSLESLSCNKNVDLTKANPTIILEVEESFIIAFLNKDAKLSEDGMM